MNDEGEPVAVHFDRYCPHCGRTTKHAMVDGEPKCEECSKRDNLLEFPRRPSQ